MLGAGSIGCILFIFLPAFPETCSFLNPADRILAVMREQEGYSQESTFVTRTTHINTKKRVVKFNFDEGLEMIKDINVWLSVAQTTIVVVILEYLVILLPQLHSDIYPVSADCGQGCRDVLSMFVFSMAPFIAGVPCSFYASSYADRNHDRTLVSMYSILLGSAGFAFIAILPSNMVSYFLGVFPSVVAMMCILPSVIAQCGDLATNETQKTTVGGVIGVFGFTLGYFVNTSLRVFVVSQGLSVKIILGFLILSIVMICYTRFSPSNTQNQSFDRNRAPGLRRLMNDTDEANAWGIEMDENSIKKSNAVKSYDATAKFETVEI